MFSKDFVQPAMSRSENAWSMFPWFCLSEKNQPSISAMHLRLCYDKPILHTLEATLPCFMCSTAFKSSLRHIHRLLSVPESDTSRTSLSHAVKCTLLNAVQHRMSKWLGRVIQIPKLHSSSVLNNNGEFERKSELLQSPFIPTPKSPTCSSN